MTTTESNNKTKIMRHTSIFFGAVFSLWASAAFLNGLAQVNWSLSELLRQYLITVGVMKEFHTFVDFYTHIKGVEYIICGLFLCGFPVYYKILNKQPVEAETV